MKLLTEVDIDRLIKNGTASRDQNGSGQVPVVKLFTPDAGCTWLLSEIDPENTDIAFGLCDLGIGCPELGSVSLSELRALRGKMGLAVERDLHFTGAYPLNVYAEAALWGDAISEDPQALSEALAKLRRRQDKETAS